MRWLWTAGRFGWPFVAVVAYSTVSIILFDYMWRVVLMPFPEMLVAGFAAWLVGLGVIVVFIRRISGR